MEILASQTNPDETHVNLLLARATLYSALAIGFRPPTAETIERLVSKQGLRTLSAAAKILDPGTGSFSSAVLHLRSRDLSLPVLEKAHAHLFGHTARGAVSPYETEYGSEALFQQPHELGDLSGFYLAFGLKLKADVHERPDHISCECEFLAFLSLKKLHALEQGDRPMADEAQKAERLFLRDHLARFVPAFALKLAANDSSGFYCALGHLCLAFVKQESRRLNVPLGAESLGLRPATDDQVPLACGNGSECGAMPGAFDPQNRDAE
jgi:DMSO reductase family type II enzyme chaperone